MLFLFQKKKKERKEDVKRFSSFLLQEIRGGKKEKQGEGGVYILGRKQKVNSRSKKKTDDLSTKLAHEK